MYRRAYAILDSDNIFILRLKLALQMLDMDNQNLYEYEIPEEFISDFIMAKSTKYPFTLLFIDANTGIHLVKNIREKYNGSVLIVVLADKLDNDMIKKSKKNGANAFLLKTGAFTDFLDRVKRMKERYIDSKSKLFTVYGKDIECE